MEKQDNQSSNPNTDPFSEFKRMFELAKMGQKPQPWNTLSKDSASSHAQDQNQPQNWFTTSSSTPNTETQLHLEYHQIHDSQAGCDAVTILKPIDWKVQSNFAWNVDLQTPALISVQVWNPNGSEVIDFLPSQLKSWDVGPNSSSAMLQQMAIMTGTPMAPPEPPPQSISDYLWRYILPFHRQWAGNVQWVAEDPLHEVAQAYQQNSSLLTMMGAQSQVLASRVRTVHSYQNRLYQEDFYCVFQATFAPHSGLLMWSPLRLYSIRATQGQLAQATPLCHTIANSFRITAEWQHMYEKVNSILRDIREGNRRASQEMHELRMETQREINESYKESHRQRQAATDRAHERFLRYIRDVEAYHLPDGGTLDVPNKYKYVWQSDQGRVAYSNNPSYDPNKSSIGNWIKLLRVD